MLDDFSPGSGRRPARAFLRSDAPRIDLDGTWRFQLAATASSPTVGFESPDFDDAAWADITVPGHWQLQGWGAPAYTNVNYPFPVDPPHGPDEDPTGEYRREFTVGDDFPTGSAELAPETIASVQIIPRNGPGELPPGATGSGWAGRPAAGCRSSSTWARCYEPGAT